MSLATLLPAYYDWINGSIQSAKTRACYACAVRRFVAWAGDRPLTEALIADWKRARLEGGRRPRTIARDFCALWHFLDWMRDQGHQVPKRGSVRPPRLDEPVRAVVTEADVAAMFRAARMMPSHTLRARFRRGRALLVVALLAYCGLRRSELLALDCRDVDELTEGWVLRIRCGKGSEPRDVPLHDDALIVLEEWLRIRDEWVAHHGHTSDALIPTDRVRRLSHFGLETVWAETMSAAGLDDRRITPHCMRHFFATRVHSSGDLAATQRLLGHRSVRTTFDYLHTTRPAMRAAVDALRLDPERILPSESRSAATLRAARRGHPVRLAAPRRRSVG